MCEETCVQDIDKTKEATQQMGKSKNLVSWEQTAMVRRTIDPIDFEANAFTSPLTKVVETDQIILDKFFGF